MSWSPPWRSGERAETSTSLTFARRQLDLLIAADQPSRDPSAQGQLLPDLTGEQS